jgi:hypothetical protein
MGPTRVFDDLCPFNQARARLQRDRQPDAELVPVLVGETSSLTGECYLVRRWGIFVDGLCTGTLRTLPSGRLLRCGLAVVRWRDYERFADGTPCHLGVPYVTRAAAQGRTARFVLHHDPRCDAARRAGSPLPPGTPAVAQARVADCASCAQSASRPSRGARTAAGGHD